MIDIGALTVTVDVDREAWRVLHLASTALARRGLDDALAAITTRVDRMLSADVTTGAIAVGLKPFAELALREVIQIAQTTGDAALQTHQIRSVLAMAGY